MLFSRSSDVGQHANESFLRTMLESAIVVVFAAHAVRSVCAVGFGHPNETERQSANPNVIVIVIVLRTVFRLEQATSSASIGPTIHDLQSL